jgi:hypothetical protein
MSDLPRKMETCANVAIVLAGVAAACLFIQKFAAGRGGSANRGRASEISIGAKVPLAGVDWSKNGNTLLLALATGCHFCSESAPFYQRIAREVSKRNDVRVISLFPQGEANGREYLSKLGVPISDVRQASFEDIGVAGTPALILVNSSGVAAGVWMGQLPADKEIEVFAAIGNPRASPQER